MNKMFDIAIYLDYNYRAVVCNAAVPVEARCVMRLNLREVVSRPDTSIPFEFELDLTDMDFTSARCSAPIKISGKVSNSAGILKLNALLDYELDCVCARCAIEFSKHENKAVEAYLADSPEDWDNPDYFPLDGDEIDLDEVISTLFVLDMDSVLFCKEDCKGLCPTCGANLNEGSCTCRKAVDPRLAVLEQLLDG